MIEVVATTEVAAVQATEVEISDTEAVTAATRAAVAGTEAAMGVITQEPTVTAREVVTHAAMVALIATIGMMVFVIIMSQYRRRSKSASRRAGGPTAFPGK
ncbi:hypothetical protein AAVH_29340 [Aphelenchoides avenae]|nr:hypothetical protein AAVH_29340 [Aphelenchus avenae]